MYDSPDMDDTEVSYIHTYIHTFAGVLFGKFVVALNTFPTYYNNTLFYLFFAVFYFQLFSILVQFFCFVCFLYPCGSHTHDTK